MVKNSLKIGLGRVLGSIWEGLGLSGASLGRFWALLGGFLSLQNRFFFKHWAKMVSKRPFGSIWNRFGRVWGGFWGTSCPFGKPGVELASHLVRMLYVSCCPIFCYRNPRAASLRPTERHNARGSHYPPAC